MERFLNMKIGDYITFKSPTRSGNRKATRKITGFREYDEFDTVVLVTQYHGWKDFAVKPYEIISVHANKEKG